MPGVIVKGATISEKTYADSFASLFSEILPQKSSSTKVPNRLNGTSTNAETYEPIAWTYLISKTNREDYATWLVNEIFSLVIGYSTGFQVWSILEHGDAVEVFSLRCGPVSAFRELPSPREKKRDKYSNKRPLAVYTASQNGAKNSFKTLNYISLLSGEQIHSLNFSTSIQDIVVNSRIVVVTFHDRLAAFDNASLEHKFSITSCFPAVVNPVSVADVWLAYVDRNLTPRLQSGGGAAVEYKNSYTSTIFKSASYGLNAGLNLLSQYASGSSSGTNGGSQLQQRSSCSPNGSVDYYRSPDNSPSSPYNTNTLVGLNSSPHFGGPGGYSALNSRNGIPSSPQATFHMNHSSKSNNSHSNSACLPGVVTVVNILKVRSPSGVCKHVTVGTNETTGASTNGAGSSSFEEIVAHFVAHHNEAVVAMHLTNRAILATAGEYGHVFNVFKIHSHPWSSSFSAVHHLYTLKRGETIAKINHISLSEDLRWVVASSSKGTTHLFAMNPYGGQPTPRTHCSSKVVNKEDKFYCSAGLDDVIARQTSATAANHHLSLAASSSAAYLSSSPSSPSFESHKLMSVASSSRCSSSFRAVLNGCIGHPWLPPYPLPTSLDPVAQIKVPSSMTSVPAACFPSGLNMNEIAVGNLFAAPCFNLDAFQLDAFSGLNSDFLSGAFDVNGVLSSPGSRSSDKAVSVDNTCAYTFSLYTFFGSIPGVLLETSVRVCRDLSNRDCIEINDYPTAQWNIARCASWAEVKPRSPEENNCASSGKGGRGSKGVSSSRAAKTDQLAYQSQMSHDSTKTMTDYSLHNSGDHDFLCRTTGEGRGVNGKVGGRSCELETRTSEYNIWMSQVEMNTHASPHRRLWMGPQFTFKTIQGNKTGVEEGVCRNSQPNFAFEDMGSNTDCGTGMASVSLHSVPSFQTIDKFQLEQLRMNSCISPLVKSRNVITPPPSLGSQQRRLGPSSSLTPPTSSSSCGASPPDQQQPPFSAVNNQGLKSNPVPIFNYTKNNSGGGGSGLKSRNKSDSGDSISSTGSAGSSYPFFIEVGSGDFERCRAMLNVNSSMPTLPNATNSSAMVSDLSAGSSAASGTALNCLGGRGVQLAKTIPISRKGSSTSVEDFASWGEDTNLDDAINSIENEPPPLISDDFHDALDEINGLKMNDEKVEIKHQQNNSTRIGRGGSKGESVDLIAIGSCGEDQRSSAAVSVNGQAPSGTLMNGTATKSSKSKKNKNKANKSSKSKKEAAAAVTSQKLDTNKGGANEESGLEDLLAEAMLENNSPANKEGQLPSTTVVDYVRPISSDDSSSLTGVDVSRVGCIDKWGNKNEAGIGGSSSSDNNFYPVSSANPVVPSSSGRRRRGSRSSNSSLNDFPSTTTSDS